MVSRLFACKVPHALSRGIILAVILSTLASTSLTSTAMAARKTIGVIMTGDIPFYMKIHETFVNRINAAMDVKYIIQSPAPEQISWNNAARKLAVLGVNIIVAYGAPATMAATKETSTIPIVFAGVYNPNLLSVRGHNATGVTSWISMEEAVTSLKRIRDFSTLAVIFNRREKETIQQAKEIKKLEGTHGFSVQLHDAGQRGFASYITDANAILITTTCAGMCGLEDITTVARRLRVPTMSTLSESRKVVYTLSPDPVEQGEKLAETTLKILGGASPSSIPLEYCTRILRIVDLEEAALIGVAIPTDLLDSATYIYK